jgi:hypothetical protein
LIFVRSASYQYHSATCEVKTKPSTVSSTSVQASGRAAGVLLKGSCKSHTVQDLSLLIGGGRCIDFRESGRLPVPLFSYLLFELKQALDFQAL